MSNAQQYYATLLLVYLGVDIIAALGLNLQFGVTGILNFAFIIFQAVGAYAYALCTLGPPGPGNAFGAGFQTYFWGTNLPFPLPFLVATLAGAGLSLLVGAVILPRLRGDYQAMAFLVVSLIATGVATNQIGLLNGANGLSLVPKPLKVQLGLGLSDYNWFYVGLTAVFTAICWWLVHRLSSSPLGRALRTVRENEQAALALGKDVRKLRMLIFAIGGGLAGLSGALLVGFISAWAPGSWVYAETFVYITAVIVGGFGSNLGVIIGVLLVPIVFGEATRFLPDIGHPGWIEAGQLIVYGFLTLVFLWFRPRGVFPERRVRYARVAALTPGPAGVGAAGSTPP
ncbi:MAG: branched-chain amino acid ABC transporter permease [Candidatus Dormibacteraeota bacterium]|nr:branched-chain amino acid ABC transporter permease [Candidatus Dormibacteraeota bacterium]